MRLNALLILGLCAASAIVAGVCRFVLRTSIPQPVLDGLFVLSVVATVSVCVSIVVRSLWFQAQNEIEDIDKSQRE